MQTTLCVLPPCSNPCFTSICQTDCVSEACSPPNRVSAWVRDTDSCVPHMETAVACRAGSSNRALVSQAVLLEHHNRQCDHDTEVLLALASPSPSLPPCCDTSFPAVP